VCKIELSRGGSILTSITRPVLAFFALAITLTCAACQTEKSNSDQSPNSPARTINENLPYDQILRLGPPIVRLDAFYTTIVTQGGKSTVHKERFTSSGRGHVAFCPDADNFINGYYLYNFFGKSSLWVSVKDRTYKAVTSSDFDDLLTAYQETVSDVRRKYIPTILKEKRIDDKYDCVGYLVKEPGRERESWFDIKTNLLVEQSIKGKDIAIVRKVVRVNPSIDTILLRQPEGFTLVEN
jgi:hypothetical protein